MTRRARRPVQVEQITPADQTIFDESRDGWRAWRCRDQGHVTFHPAYIVTESPRGSVTEPYEPKTCSASGAVYGMSCQSNDLEALVCVDGVWKRP